METFQVACKRRVITTTLVVFRFDKMESDHFKREFILRVVKAMKTALQRASVLVEGDVEETRENVLSTLRYAHCTPNRFQRKQWNDSVNV